MSDYDDEFDEDATREAVFRTMNHAAMCAKELSLEAEFKRVVLYARRRAHTTARQREETAKSVPEKALAIYAGRIARLWDVVCEGEVHDLTEEKEKPPRKKTEIALKEFEAAEWDVKASEFSLKSGCSEISPSSALLQCAQKARKVADALREEARALEPSRDA